MDNENNLGTNTYDKLIEQKLIELQNQKDEEWDEYQQKLDELQKEYNNKIDEIEESEMQIGAFRNLDSNNLTIERIEDLVNSLDSMDFSEEELVVIMSHLADLSTNDLIVENDLESPNIVKEIEEKNQEEVQKSDREIAKEIVDKYESISTEFANVMEVKASTDFEVNYNRAVAMSADSNMEKTPEQKLILEDYIAQAGKCKKKFDAIEEDFYYLEADIKGVHYKRVANNKDEIYIRINRLKKAIEEFKELLPLYQYACTRFNRVFENKEISKEEKDQTPEELKYAADFIKKLEAIENLPIELLNLLNYSVKVAYENCENEGCNKENLQMLDDCIKLLSEKAKNYDDIILDDNKAETNYETSTFNSKNLIIFLKNYDTNGFLIDEGIEKTSENNGVLNQAKKSIKSLMDKLSEQTLAELGKKPKCVLPIFDCGNWKRVRDDITRTSVLQIHICEENMKKINEFYGFAPNHDFDVVYLIGSAFVKRDGKQENDLKPLRDVIDYNQKQIEYIKELMNNPEANIDEINAIISGSIEEYELLRKAPEQRGGRRS